jgi:hypothetical protein
MQSWEAWLSRRASPGATNRPVLSVDRVTGALIKRNATHQPLSPDLLWGQHLHPRYRYGRGEDPDETAAMLPLSALLLLARRKHGSTAALRAARSAVIQERTGQLRAEGIDLLRCAGCGVARICRLTHCRDGSQLGSG